jgi:hypothetical protein
MPMPMKNIAESKDHLQVNKIHVEVLASYRYLLIIGKKKNMQVLSHTFTYFST